MTDHTPTPWRVFTRKDGRKLVGIGSEEGEGILDCGFGVWAWDDPAGVANANLVVKAVNNHDALVKALEVLLAEATSFSVSGVYFDEDCMGHKGPALARAALGAVGKPK